MNSHAETVREVIQWIIFVGLAGWAVVVSIRRAEDPARMVFKWVLTALVVAFMFGAVAPIVGQGGYTGAFGGVPLAALSSLLLAIIWRHNLAGLVAKPFSSLYDGGNIPPEPRPAYSTAQAKQKRGEYIEAAAEVCRQIERFPNDFEGHMLLAEIQAENLHDLPAAEETIHRFCAQPGHAPRNLTFALFSLADWHLKHGHDREAARRALEKVVELLPDSEFSLSAAQRIAHLASAEMLLSPEERRKFTVVEGVRHLGLVRGQEPIAAPEIEPGQAAAEYVKHLENHPLDSEAREKLAAIYIDHYHRLDLAADQLEQMISFPHQPGKLVVRWLNLLADLQIRSGADYLTVRQTLQRIIDRAPNLAAADAARKRIDLLKLELKANQLKQSVKLGAYEQDLGLKHGRKAWDQ